MTPPSFYFERIQKTLQDVAETEHEYLLQGGDKTVHTSFMPYQPADFLAIMSDVVAAANGAQFLDVGCGPGTKMTLAQEIFGLYPVGVEIDAEMARKARESFGPAVYTGDALTDYSSIYSTVDIIWLYRPFKDGTKEDELERLIMHRMKPGAILVGGAWEMPSPPHRWITIVDDWELRRGAFMKPGNITGLQVVTEGMTEKSVPQLAQEDHWRNKLRDAAGTLDERVVEQQIVELLVGAYEDGFSDGWRAMRGFHR